MENFNTSSCIISIHVGIGFTVNLFNAILKMFSESNVLVRLSRTQRKVFFFTFTRFEGCRPSLSEASLGVMWCAYSMSLHLTTSLMDQQHPQEAFRDELICEQWDHCRVPVHTNLASHTQSAISCVSGPLHKCMRTVGSKNCALGWPDVRFMFLRRYMKTSLWAIETDVWRFI